MASSSRVASRSTKGKARALDPQGRVDEIQAQIRRLETEIVVREDIIADLRLREAEAIKQL